MPIWSLTQEKIDKLKNQIGDKEEEMDQLIKLSPKDLWLADLDEFLEEWQTQLSEERARSKKIQRLGRRASAKLRIGGGNVGGKGRKKKANDSDDSDFDIAPKSKKSAPKQNALTNFLAGAAAPSSQSSDKPPARPEPALSSMDGIEETVPAKSAKTSTIARGRPAKTAPTKTGKVKDEGMSDDEDVFAAIAKDAPVTTLPSRQARGATKKPVKYALSDDSDSENGDSLLGDVTNMVKGISNGTASDANGSSRPLFSASVARPSSSQGRPSMKPASRKSTINISDDDETDYTKLVPQPSPQRPAARTANETILSDDSEDEFGFGLKKAKAVPKAAPKPKPAAPVPRVAKPAVTKAKASSSSTLVAKKSLQLSPAAKAYAAKKAKTLSGKLPSKKTKEILSDEDDDMDAIASELLSGDEEDAAPAKSAPAARPSARPGRRAAANIKAKYMVSDESEEDASEAAFDESLLSD